MTLRRPDVNRLLMWYLRRIGGGDWPFLSAERRYLASRIAAGAAVADVGGGNGQLANFLAPKVRRVLILDRETTSLPGADTARYAGSLKRAVTARTAENVSAIKGDAVSLPFAPESLDAIVSSQLLEHIAAAGQVQFFAECARVLKPSGVLALSTPNADYFGRHTFWFAVLARKMVPKSWLPRLPRSLRGVWLEQDIGAWELSVGHYDHGCRSTRLRAYSEAAGFDEIDSRFLHSWLTAFSFQLLCTFPLIYLAALPVVRLLYWLETQLAPRDGINLLLTFRKRDVVGSS
jgi:SAM-dependent methyltransferase